MNPTAATPQPHARLTSALAAAPGVAALTGAFLLLVGLSLPWLQVDPDRTLPGSFLGVDRYALTALAAVLIGGAGLRMLRGHHRPAALLCLAAGSAVFLAVGDLWTAVDAQAWSAEQPNELDTGAWVAALGALLAVIAGAFAARDRPPGWTVSALLGVVSGEAAYERALSRRTLLMMAFGPTLVVLVPTVVILVLAAFADQDPS